MHIQDIIRQHIYDHEELENMAQTTAEFLIEQGMQLGVEQGKAEGKAEQGKQDRMQSSSSYSSDFSTCQKRSPAKSAISTTTRAWIFS